LRKKAEDSIGYRLEILPSQIDHFEAGKGVFLSCKKTGKVLPGTLLGFLPGFIHPHDEKVPEVEPN